MSTKIQLYNVRTMAGQGLGGHYGGMLRKKVVCWKRKVLDLDKSFDRKQALLIANHFFFLIKIV